MVFVKPVTLQSWCRAEPCREESIAGEWQHRRKWFERGRGWIPADQLQHSDAGPSSNQLHTLEQFFSLLTFSQLLVGILHWL